MLIQINLTSTEVEIFAYIIIFQGRSVVDLPLGLRSMMFLLDYLVISLNHVNVRVSIGVW